MEEHKSVFRRLFLQALAFSQGLNAIVSGFKLFRSQDQSADGGPSPDALLFHIFEMDMENTAVAHGSSCRRILAPLHSRFLDHLQFFVHCTRRLFRVDTIM